VRKWSPVRPNKKERQGKSHLQIDNIFILSQKENGEQRRSFKDEVALEISTEQLTALSSKNEQRRRRLAKASRESLRLFVFSC
jgi:hypothetical protein